MRIIIGFGAIMVLGLLFLGIGILRGITRSRIRLICLLGCAIASFAITLVLKSQFPFYYSLFSEILQNRISGLAENDFWKMFDGSALLRDTLMQTAGALVAPLVFLAVFLVLQLGTLIIYWIVMIFIGRKLRRADAKRRVKFPRVLGLSLAQAAIVLFVFLTPIALYSQIARTAVNTIQESGVVEGKPLQIAEKMTLISKEESGFVKAYRVLGGNAVCKSLTRMKIDGEKTNLVDEISIIAEFTGEFLSLKNVGDITAYGESEARIVENMGQTFGKSKLLSTIGGEIVYQITEKWNNGESFMNISKPDVDEMVEPSFEILIADFHQDSRNSSAIQADFNTLSDVVLVMVQADVMENIQDREELITKLASGNTIKSIILILDRNATLKNLVPEVTNLGMRLIGNMLSLPGNSSEVYESFIQKLTVSVNQILRQNITYEEKADRLTDSLMKCLAESGVDVRIDRESMSLYANAMLTEFDGRTSVTAVDIREFFQVYAAVQQGNAKSARTKLSYLVPLDETELVFRSEFYAGKTLEELKNTTGAGMLACITSEIVEAGKNAENNDAFSEKVQSIIEKYVDVYAKKTGKTALAETIKAEMKKAQIRIDSISENDLKLTASINAESFPTVIVTLEALLIDPDGVPDGMTPEAMEKEAEVINDLFRTAVLLNEKMSEEENPESFAELAEKVGIILDTMSQTDLFGEEMAVDLITAVFQSEQMKEALDLDLLAATELARGATESTEDGKIDYTATMISAGRAMEIAKMIGESDGDADEEEIREMLQNMTPQAAKMMCMYITPERMEKYGISKEKSVSSAIFLQGQFTEMSKQALYRDKYQEQIKATAKMFDIAMAASRKNGEQSLFNHGKEKGRLDMTAAEMIEAIMRSDLVCNAAIGSMTENGKLKAKMFNPFGVRIAEESADVLECREAVLNYYNDHKSERQKIGLKLTVVAAIFGVSVDLPD